MVKVSDIDANTIAEYLHIDATDPLIPGLYRAAIGYATSYTGRTEEELDLFEDMYIAILVLCSDFYDQRTEHTDKPKNNNVVNTILSLHSVNLLPRQEVEA